MNNQLWHPYRKKVTNNTWECDIQQVQVWQIMLESVTNNKYKTTGYCTCTVLMTYWVMRHLVVKSLNHLIFLGSFHWSYESQETWLLSHWVILAWNFQKWVLKELRSKLLKTWTNDLNMIGTNQQRWAVTLSFSKLNHQVHNVNSYMTEGLLTYLTYILTRNIYLYQKNIIWLLKHDPEDIFDHSCFIIHFCESIICLYTGPYLFHNPLLKETRLLFVMKYWHVIWLCKEHNFDTNYLIKAYLWYYNTQEESKTEEVGEQHKKTTESDKNGVFF